MTDNYYTDTQFLDDSWEDYVDENDSVLVEDSGEEEWIDGFPLYLEYGDEEW